MSWAPSSPSLYVIPFAANWSRTLRSLPGARKLSCTYSYGFDPRPKSSASRLPHRSTLLSTWDKENQYSVIQTYLCEAESYNPKLFISAMSMYLPIDPIVPIWIGQSTSTLSVIQASVRESPTLALWDKETFIVNMLVLMYWLA